jgi:hypothetical protein
LPRAQRCCCQEDRDTLWKKRYHLCYCIACRSNLASRKSFALHLFHCNDIDCDEGLEGNGEFVEAEGRDGIYDDCEEKVTCLLIRIAGALARMQAMLLCLDAYQDLCIVRG